MQSNSTNILPAALSSAFVSFAFRPSQVLCLLTLLLGTLVPRHHETSTLPVGLYSADFTNHCMGFCE